MQEERRKLQAENDKNSMYCDKALGECSEGGEPDDEPVAKEEGDSGIDANSQVTTNIMINNKIGTLSQNCFIKLERNFTCRVPVRLPM